MTTTTWTTRADVPPAPWAAAAADIRVLLTAMASAGAQISGRPFDTNAEPVFTDDEIAFTVTLPDRGPLTVEFERAAGTSTVETSSPLTDGLVHVALSRAQKHWGQLLTWSSDASVTAQALCTALTERLYGAADRQVVGGAAPSLDEQVVTAVAAARDRVTAGAAAAGRTPSLPEYLTALISDLTAQRNGAATAAGLFPAAPVYTPPPAPVPEPEPQPVPVPDEDGESGEDSETVEDGEAETDTGT